MKDGRRWFAYGAVALLMVLGAATVGQLGHEWLQSTRIENADMDCSARGGVLDHDDLSCVQTSADGMVTDVGYPLNPSTLEGVALVAVAVIVTLAIEVALFAFLWLTWRWIRQSSITKARTPSNGLP